MTTRPGKQKENVVVALKGGAATQIDLDGASYQIVLPHAATDYIQKKIASERAPYELPMLEDMRKRLSAGDLVLDIGANIGNHALYLAAAARCRVVAFEPNASLCDALTASIAINNFKKHISVQPFALGRENATGHFTRELPENLGAQSIELGEGDIHVVPLDGFSFRTAVAAIKIDVEGMELDVLQGGEALLMADRPLVYVECADLTHFNEVAGWLAERGYVHWDTFNATPTHLFLPGESVALEDNIARLQNKIVQEHYGTADQLAATRKQLDEANLKYRTAMELIATLKDSLSREESARKLAEQAAGQGADALQQAQAMLAQLQKQHDETSVRAEQLEEGRHLREQQLTDLRLRLSDAERYQQRARLLEGQAAELERKLTETSLRAQTLEQDLRDAQMQAALATQAGDHARHLHEQAEARHGQLQQEAALLHQQLAEQREAFHSAEKRSIELKGQVAVIQAGLDDARLKYRQVNEKYAQLKALNDQQQEALE